MESSPHLHLLLLLLTSAIGPCAVVVAETCESSHWAILVSMYCVSDDNDGKLACCKVLQYVMYITLTEDPRCLCRLNEEPSFMTTGLFTDELVDRYIACGGDGGNKARALSDKCELQIPPQHELLDGPVQAEAIFTVQDTPSLAPAALP